MMDLRHLESDELEVEFNVRKIDQRDDGAWDSLSRMIIDEQSDMRVLPSLPPFFKTSSEMSLCKRKMTQMEQERLERAAIGDELALGVLRSRALHLVSRLERLAVYASENVAVTKVLEDARKLWERMVPARREGVELNNSREPELEGFTASGIALSPASNFTGSVQNSPTGAIHKPPTSNPKVNPQPPPGQLPAWHDPSIIKTGRPSVPSASNVVPGSAFHSFMQSAAQAQPGENSRGDPNYYLGARQLPPNVVPGAQGGNFEESVARGAIQGRNRPGLTHTLSKWTVRFGGSAKDLAVDEFFFRVENLATADNVHADSLVLGLHCLLVGNASDFYWVQRRKYPNHTWVALKRSMIAHFARQETDLEIRKLIMDRRQGYKEDFGEFSLAIECLSARMVRRMEDNELMEILRQNMSPKLQTCLLMYPTQNVESLKGACRKFERLWATQSDSIKDHRITSRMAELGFDDAPQVEEVRGSVRSHFGEEATSNGFNVDAVVRPRPLPNRNEYMVCWNCDDIGHSFGDCTSPDRKVFCYGCGTKNAYKPSCIQCNPGNAKPGGIVQGQSRSTPNPFNLIRANTHQHPK